MKRGFTLLLILFSAEFAQAATFQIGLHDAEKQAAQVSNRLKSYEFEEAAADAQASAQVAGLFPRLTIQGNDTYFFNIPRIQIAPQFPAIPFGTNNTYSVGPALSYTLWDSFSARDSWHAAEAMEKSRGEDRRNAELQLLLSVRSTYVQVQLGLAELGLINDSLNLAKAQEADVRARYSAGAATKLDLVTAQRSVLSYEIQFKQRQSDLSSSLRDLLALLDDHEVHDVSKPGPEGVPGVLLVLKLDPLRQTLEEQSRGRPAPPDEQQPQIRSQAFQAESFQFNSDSQSARLLPVVQLSGGVSYNLPNIPNPPSYWQETVGVSVSLPLFLGDPTPKLAAQQRHEAEAAEQREAQLKSDLGRDYAKGLQAVENLREQKALALKDVAQSEEAAKLYYTTYRAGRLNFIDVQNANVQALTAKVNAARIDAQLITQLVLLKSISGEETHRD